MKENKAQSKQAEDKRVFLRFGDNLAVDSDPHQAVATAGATRRKIDSSKIAVIEGSPRNEVADGFVD